MLRRTSLVVVDLCSNVGGVLYVHRTHFYFLRKRYKSSPDAFPLYTTASTRINLMSRRTGKHTADGNYAASRLGQPLTARWANKRLRQVMLLVRALRTEWPNQSLLFADDVEIIRATIDTALAMA